MLIENFYIVEYDGRTIGIWDSLESAKTFILGCQQNGLMISSANIKTYKINTCFCLKTESINITNFDKPQKQTKFAINYDTVVSSDENHQTKIESVTSNSINIKSTNVESEEKSVVTKSERKKIDPKDPAYIEMTKQKIELQHKINMLKQQKKKIEESKITYANDYKLFELFTESKQKDVNFVIPEIFTKKFDLMTQLKNENKLTWENFIKEYQHENFYNQYFGLNSYEEMFLKSDDEDKSDISEELDIESDSSTETSDSDSEEN